MFEEARRVFGALAGSTGCRHNRPIRSIKLQQGIKGISTCCGGTTRNQSEISLGCGRPLLELLILGIPTCRGGTSNLPGETALG